jgi:hypothetical protein
VNEGMSLAATETRTSDLPRCRQPTDLPYPASQCGTRDGKGAWAANPIPQGPRRTVFDRDVSFGVDWFDPEYDGDVCALTPAQEPDLAGRVMTSVSPVFVTQSLFSGPRRHVFRKTGRGATTGKSGSSATFSFSYAMTIVRTR